MPSKMVTDRKKSADTVIAAARSHGAAIQRTANQTLSLVIKKGEPALDLVSLTEFLARSIEKARDVMTAADDAHEAELRDDSAPREARDASAAALTEDIVELREVVTGLLGSK